MTEVLNIHLIVFSNYFMSILQYNPFLILVSLMTMLSPNLSLPHSKKRKSIERIIHLKRTSSGESIPTLNSITPNDHIAH